MVPPWFPPGQPADPPPSDNGLDPGGPSAWRRTGSRDRTPGEAHVSARRLRGDLQAAPFAWGTSQLAKFPSLEVVTALLLLFLAFGDNLHRAAEKCQGSGRRPSRRTPPRERLRMDRRCGRSRLG